MKHYGVSQWVDFARGLLTKAETQAMRAHLAEGCAGCEDVAKFCESLAGISREMASIEVPERVVRNARAIFPAAALVEPKRAARISVELIYDSLLAPEPAGLRANWQTGWQALYRAGDCSLDLRVEPELSTTRAAVIGQISNHLAPETKMADVPVFLKSGKSIVAETRSNRFGEFQMEYEQQGRLQLCVYLQGGSQCFQVPLKKFTIDKSLGADWAGPIPGPPKAGQD
jgi:hypothetical protein